LEHENNPEADAASRLAGAQVAKGANEVIRHPKMIYSHDLSKTAKLGVELAVSRIGNLKMHAVGPRTTY
jgi:hypothetical protein